MAEFNLSRKYKLFTGVVGIRMMILETRQSDGLLLYEKEIQFGEQADVRLDVEGVLRLKLLVIHFKGPADDHQHYAIWGGPGLIGRDDAGKT